MRVAMVGGSQAIVGAKVQSFSILVTEAQITVGLVMVPIIAAVVANTAYLVTLTNSSPAAQNIRIGTAPSFGAPVMGYLLQPTWGVIWDNLGIPLNAIADGAGRLLEVIIWRTP